MGNIKFVHAFVDIRSKVQAIKCITVSHNKILQVFYFDVKELQVSVVLYHLQVLNVGYQEQVYVAYTKITNLLLMPC
jgi:hypothetical protein